MLKFKIPETYSRTGRRMTDRRPRQTVHRIRSMSHVTITMKVDVLSEKIKGENLRSGLKSECSGLGGIN